MNELLLKLMGRAYRAEAGDGDAGGGTVDRGDDFIPTDEPAKNEPEPEVKDEELEEEQPEEEQPEEEEEQPRSKDGKFAKKEATIPKARFDELNRKSREREQALADRIAELERSAKRDAEQQDVEKLNGEIESLEEAYQKQLDAGETAKARETMRQIRLKERQVIEAQVEHKSERARQLAVEQFKVDMLVERLEADFPALNPNSDDYDQDVVDEIGFLRASFEKSGMASSAAIARAVKYVLGEAKKAAAEPETETKGKGLNPGKKDERRTEQVKKNVDAAKKQPADLNKAGIDSNKKGGGIDTNSINDMSEDEFNALPASTKARLRGDFFSEEAA